MTGKCSDEFKRFVLFFVVILLVYSLYLRQTYNMDMIASYGHPVTGAFGISLLNYDPVGAIRASVQMGRYLWVVYYTVLFVLYHLGITQVRAQFVFQLIGFLFLTASSCVLYEIFKKVYTGKKEVLYISSLLIVISPAFTEILAYTCFDYCVAFFICVLAVRFFVDNKYLFSVLLLVTVFGIYQSFYADFLILIFTYVILTTEKDEGKRKVIDCGKAILLDVFAVIIYSIITSVLITVCNVQPLRSVSFGTPSVMLERLIHIIPRYGLSVLTGGGVLPTGLILGIIIVLSVCIISTQIRRKKPIRALAYFIYLAIIGLLPTAVHVFEEIPYLPPRTLTGSYAAIGCIILVFFSSVPEGVIFSFCELTIAIYCIFMIIGVNNEISDIATANKLEIMNLRQIGQKIEGYEASTGNTIERIGVYHFGDEAVKIFDDENLSYYGPYYYTPHIITGYNWSDVEALNYFIGAEYKRFSMSEDDRERFFSDYLIDDIGVFDIDRQIQFEGNTMYWLAY